MFIDTYKDNRGLGQAQFDALQAELDKANKEAAKKAEIAEGAERIRSIEGKGSPPKQYWIIFNDPQAASQAYNLLKNSENSPLFGENLLGFSFDNTNPNGIEINFIAPKQDLRQNLRGFFENHGLFVREIHIPKASKTKVLHFPPPLDRAA